MKTISKISCALLGAMLLSSIFSGLVVGITEAVKIIFKYTINSDDRWMHVQCLVCIFLSTFY
mgnify:FL=1